ncbi:MAG TPA: molybdopterin cofactor-binding domain-containing protein [Thermodesulfobacteriota bacterium]|nr:molybdopterin cofactor-binding domain-containing protein [Thermodesulfobacteriota bacterium]
MKQPVELKVNGQSVRMSVEGSQTLLEFLREELGLTGTKRGCDQGDCGACTVLMDGRPVNACLVLVSEVVGKEITTIEGLSPDGKLHPLQEAFVDDNAVQCGFCTPGMILTAVALLNENPDPSPEEIRQYLQGNLCRCTGYNKIAQAIQSAARRLSHKKERPRLPKEVRRLEAPEKTTGDAMFVGDMKRPGLLAGKILRSQVPHARIKRIKTEKALSLPGVEAVITAQDFPEVRWGLVLHDETVMARDKIRYVGEPVAAVAAVDQETAQRALDLIELEIEELPGVFTFEESIDPQAPLVHEKFKEYTSRVPLQRDRNICFQTRIKKGDIEKGFLESDEVFEDTYTMPVVHQAPLEPRAVLAEVDPYGRLQVWCSTARSFNIRSGLAEVLQFPMSSIRVTGARIGGGFGGKGEISIEPIAAMLAMKTKRPVKIELTRREDFLSATPRHSMEIWIKTGVKKDGTLVAMQAKIKVDTGAYAYFGPNTTSNAVILITGPYRIPNLLTEGICAYTNKISCGPCRGPGAPQVHFAGETQLDKIARKLGMDPVELRMKNAYKADDLTATGQVLTEGGYWEALAQLKMYMGEHLTVLPGVDEGKAFGVGVAGGFWGMGGFGSSATVRLNEDGSVILSMGAVEIGAGSDTAMALLVSQELGIPLERIRVISGDTDTCPYDFGAIGSRTTQVMGVAVHQAVEGVKKQLLAFAAGHLKIPTDSLAFGGGKIYVSERPEVAIPIAKAAHLLTLARGPVVATGSHAPQTRPFNPEFVENNVAPSRPFFSYGAQAIAVQVDKVTGKVDVLKVVASHNVGKAVFSAGIEGQIQGGVAMGLGYALSEEVIFSNGKPLNDTFLDYRLPTMMDVPEIVPVIVEKENAKSPEDIRGVGEPATIPTAAAVANAVYDAVGVRVSQLPMTPEKVYWALKRLKRKE